MPVVLRDMLGSKKAIAMIAGLVVSCVGKYGLDLPTEELTAVLSPILAYVLGQGVADVGKEKARLGVCAVEIDAGCDSVRQC